VFSKGKVATDTWKTRYAAGTPQKGLFDPHICLRNQGRDTDISRGQPGPAARPLLVQLCPAGASSPGASPDPLQSLSMANLGQGEAKPSGNLTPLKDLTLDVYSWQHFDHYRIIASLRLE